MQQLVFGGDRVGLIVRGKTGPYEHPGCMDQHADCVLSNGAPIGFYGEGGGMSARVGMGMRGAVYDMAKLRKKRPGYVDLSLAKELDLESSALVITVGRAAAAKFDAYWKRLVAHPGTFDFLGGNCSTHASAAFRAAGILSRGIPGLDTPEHLYEQIRSAKRGLFQALTGYLGFVPFSGGYAMQVDAVAVGSSTAPSGPGCEGLLDII